MILGGNSSRNMKVIFDLKILLVIAFIFVMYFYYFIRNISL